MLQIIALLTSAVCSFAQTPPLALGQTMDLVQLLEYVDRPDHFVLLGRSEAGYHTFEIHGGTFSEWRSLDQQETPDGIRLKYDGEMTLSTHHGSGLRPLDGTSVPFTRFGDRARDVLRPRPITEDILHALGVNHLIRPRIAPVTKIQADLPLPSDGVVILVNLRFTPDLSRESILRQQLTQTAARVGPSCHLIEGLNTLPAGVEMLVCSPGQIDRMLTLVREIDSVDAVVLREGVDLFRSTPWSSLADARKALSYDAKSIAGRAAALGYLADHPSELAAHVAGSDSELTLECIQAAMRMIDQITVSLRKVMEQDLRGKPGTPEYWLHPWFERVLDPITDQYADLLDALSSLNDPGITKLILRTSTGGLGVGLPTIWTTAAVDAWLEWQLEHVRDILKAPTGPEDDRREGDHWVSDVRGGFFRHIKVNAQLTAPTWFNRPRRRDLFHLENQFDFPAAGQLGSQGRSDHRIIKRKIIEFVIAADRIVGSQLPRLNDGLDFEEFVRLLRPSPESRPLLRKYWETHRLTPEECARVVIRPYFAFDPDHVLDLFASIRESSHSSTRYTGSLVVAKVLEALNRTLPEYDAYRGWDPDLYFGNVIDIVGELLEDADEVVSTEGTYLKLLDLGMDLQRMDSVSPDLALKQSHLGQIIQRRLLRSATGCEGLLGDRRRG